MQPNLNTAQQEFLQRLRESTRPMHDDLEAQPLSKKLMAKPLELTDYAHYLKKMHRLHKDYEQYIVPQLKSDFPDLDSRERLTALNHDLAQLQITPEKNSTNIFEDLHPEEMPGVMYVIEGSTLGGRVILKSVADSFNYTDEQLDNVTRYFQGHGADTGKMWMSFLEQFAAHAVHSGTEEHIIRGAQKAYKAIASL